MTERDMDRLDRSAAEAMGTWAPGKKCHGAAEELCELPNSSDGWYCPKCGYEGAWGEDHAIKEHDALCPSPTRSWSDFGALLLWCAEKGLAPMVRYGLAIQMWNGSLGDENGVVIASEYDADPRLALCAAVEEWGRGK